MHMLDLLPRRTSRTYRTPLRVEALESRTVPYAASGNAWPHPELITVSFEPDGTDLGGQSSNLFATFNAEFGSASAWQTPILTALQTWAQQTNLNFTVIGDNGSPSGSGSYQQGDPGIGDIRIGGFDFGNSTAMALGYMPPPVNNYSVAGDIVFNTGQVFNINGLDYDLYTVAVHEVGHALGLDHSATSAAVMYPNYQGIESGLYADDLAGIRSIYSGGAARSPDAFDATGSHNTFATAIDLTSRIDATSLTAAVTGLDVTTTSQVDYYKFTAPAGTSGTLKLTVQSTGLSLLAPSVRVYNASQSQLASATGNGTYGSTLTLNVSVTPGQTYYVRVAGANSTAFGTGAYGLTLNLGTGSSPSVTPPNTQTPNGNPLNGGGGVADRRDANGLSVSLLLSGIGNTAVGLLNRLGLTGLGGLTGNLLGFLNRTVNSVVDLPFVDLITTPADRSRLADAASTALPAAEAPTLAPSTVLPGGPLFFNSGESLPAAGRTRKAPGPEPVAALDEGAGLTATAPVVRTAPVGTIDRPEANPAAVGVTGGAAAAVSGDSPGRRDAAVLHPAPGRGDTWGQAPHRKPAAGGAAPAAEGLPSLPGPGSGEAPTGENGAADALMPDEGRSTAMPDDLADVDGVEGVVQPAAGLAGMVVLFGPVAGRGSPEAERTRLRA
jgi:hypothetical protein